MLQILREKAQGLITWLIVFLLSAAFVLFGLSDFFSVRSSSTYAAKVGRVNISWATVDALVQRLAKRYGDQVDPSVLRQNVLDALIERTALLNSAKKLGFFVTEQQIANYLSELPTFQDDGKFSKERYLKILSESGYSDEAYRQELSQDLLMGQLEQGLAQSGFILEDELVNSVAQLDQKRNFGFTILPVKKYQSEVKITPEAIQAYYEKQKTKFVKPERVVLEYVALTSRDVGGDIKPTEQEILNFYKQHEAQYSMPERVQARHILITAAENDPASNKKAKEKIESISKELAQGGSFEKLAAKNSEDPGSAANGGDLGWFVKGQMVPPFEKAAFELKKPGEISPAVRTQFGYHLIQLIEHRAAEVRSFAEVKSLATEQLVKELSENLFREKAEEFAKIGFEQANTLAPVVEQFNLELQETPPITRQGGPEIASNPEVIKIAFSDEVLKQGHNSEPLKLKEGKVAIFRLKNHQPAVQETLAEATPSIEKTLTQEKAKELVKKAGEELVKAIWDSNNPATVAKDYQLDWTAKTNVMRATPDINREVLAAAFQIPPMDKDQKLNVRGFGLPSGDYLVVALNKVAPGVWSSLDEKTKTAYIQGLGGISNQIEYALYLNQILSNTSVEYSKNSP